jgi:NAD(P)-dependent dehydrogenase (short-subunit alcohol dehydrogenase family)
MRRLEGHTALVTGGTRGIGEAIATRLAREGARTIVVSRKADGVAAAVQRIRDASGGEVHGDTLHVGDLASLSDAVARWTDAYGPIDLLVNNAAANPYFGPMIGAELPAWQKTFEVNVFGAFELTRLITQRLMAEERPGSVVFVSSILGVQSAPFQGIYGATKAAVISLVKTLAVELGAQKIRVNAVAPGLVDTRFATALTSNPEILGQFMSHTALGRIAQPEEIAGAVAFLLSGDAGYVTGETLAVDGGYLVR